VQEARDALMLTPRRVKVGPSIGAGGNGEVHRGTFARKPCVFKAVFTSNDDEFWREAKLLSELDHPNVVNLFGVVEMKARSKYGGHTNELLMVMEYVQRGSIADAAKSGAYVPRQHWHRHAVELATAVAWLHDQGVVHRDLKPANVLLADDGSIKICDLGVSRRQSEGGAAATVQDMMTMTVGVGTFPFMPPEVMRDAARQHDEEEGGAAFGDRHRYDGRAVDVYSLAITLIQMWTCKQLYPGAGAVDVSVGAVCCFALYLY
jgi:serine/threonine-protein kinase